MARLMYNVKDVQEILGVGESKAYQFIRILNEELRGKYIIFWSHGEMILK